MLFVLPFELFIMQIHILSTLISAIQLSPFSLLPTFLLNWHAFVVINLPSIVSVPLIIEQD